ncbi:MAG: hypothetical protein A3E01_09990 [Gammaproteobacteria bacterium RIFCSPHIGHO2_12_FULL_63_22]|nr:MAG: hypothetical protein A3E01_09990 [Gammaproteobacteria bacterium RIFCSPHIGHO2_12_FULL_63_22]
MRLLAIAVTLVLAACATDRPAPEPIVRTVEVKVPVQVPCRPELGEEPAYPDTDEALAMAPDIFVGVQLLKSGRGLRIQRDREKTAALAGCAGAP